jgi:RHS repeat-associated protein
LTLLFIFLWCIILQAGILLIFLNTPWGDQAFKKSLVGFFSAGAGLPRGPENQYAKSYTSFSSRFRFNEGRAFKNKPVAYFSEGASLPRWQWDKEPTLWSSRAPLKDEWGEQTGNYCYGARYYDPKISVWLSVDPLAHKYPSLSPYVYVANNPINAIDPDGRRIVFVNGYLGFGSYNGGKAYWNSSFIKAAMRFFGDNSAAYTNVQYSTASTAAQRTLDGYAFAKKNFAKLTKGMKEGETFKFVTHSMGGAFSKGMKEYFEEQSIEVESMVMLNTFQADGVEFDPEDPTEIIDYKTTNDPVMQWLDDPESEIEGADQTIREKSEKDIQFRHRDPIASGSKVWNTIKNWFNSSGTESTN